MAEAEVLKQFSQELASLYDSKPPVSKAKMVQLTKAALKGLKYYKHVVMAVEKFIHRCKPEYKLPGLYVIDSIVRQSKHQFGTDKDVFAPRFGKNLSVTLQACSTCNDEDRPRIFRVLSLWLQNGVFSEDVLRPILDTMSNNNSNLAKNSNTDLQNVTDTITKPINSDKSKRVSIASPLNPSKEADRKDGKPLANIGQPVPAAVPVLSTKPIPPALTPSSNPANVNIDPSIFQQIQKLTTTLITQQQKSVESERKLTKKILAEYDYSDEDDSVDADGSDKADSVDGRDDIKVNLATAAQNLLNNPQLLEQIQKMQQSMRGGGQSAASTASTTTITAPPTAPMTSSMTQQHRPSAIGPLMTTEPQPMTAVEAATSALIGAHPGSPPKQPLTGTAAPIPTGVPAPPTPGVAAPFSARFPINFSIPPPTFLQQPPPQQQQQSQQQEQHPQIPMPRNFDSQALNYPPPAEPLPPGFESSSSDSLHNRKDQDDRVRSLDDSSPSSRRKKRKSRDHDRSRSGSRSHDKKRKRRSKSKSRSRSHSKRRHHRKHSSSNRTHSKDRHREKERERERRSRGFLPVKSRHVSIYSRTLWFGRVPASCEEGELKEALKEYGEPVAIDLIPPRGCAYIVMPDRKSAHKVLDRLKDLKIQNRTLKMAWAPGKGVKDAFFDEGWDMDSGVTYIGWERLPQDLTPLIEGGTLDVDSLPEHMQSAYDERGLIGAASLSTGLGPNLTTAPTSTATGSQLSYPRHDADKNLLTAGGDQGSVSSQSQSEPGTPSQPVPAMASHQPMVYPPYQIPPGPGMYPAPFAVPPPGSAHMMHRMVPPPGVDLSSQPQLITPMAHGHHLNGPLGMPHMRPPPNFMTPPPRHRFGGGGRGGGFRRSRFPSRGRFPRYNNNSDRGDGGDMDMEFYE